LVRFDTGSGSDATQASIAGWNTNGSSGSEWRRAMRA
jgi:hypothetical protein